MNGLQSQRLFLELKDEYYNADEKKYKYKLKQCWRPKEIHIDKCVLTLDSDEPYLIMNSKNIHKRSKSKPALMHHGHSNAVFLISGESCPHTMSVSQTSSVTEAEILALNPTIYLKYNDKTRLVSSTGNEIQVGDSISSVASQMNSILFNASSTGLKYRAFGTTGLHGIRSEISWHYLKASNVTIDEEMNSSITFFLETGNVATLKYIWVSPAMRLTVNQGYLGHQNSNTSGAHKQSNIPLQNNTRYLIQWFRELHSNSASHQHFKVLKLDTNTLFEDTNGGGGTITLVTPWNAYHSRASTGFLDMIFGDLFYLANATYTNNKKVWDYFVNSYNPEGTTVETTAYRIKDNNRERLLCNQMNHSLDEIDFQFTDKNDGIIKPINGCVGMTIIY